MGGEGDLSYSDGGRFTMAHSSSLDVSIVLRRETVKSLKESN